MNRIIFIPIMLISQFCLAQVIVQPKPVELDLKGVVYTDEELWEIRPHFHGAALAFKKGTLLNYYETQYLNFEIGFIKDNGEKRQNKNAARISGVNRSSFVYGKRNNFFVGRASYGFKRYLSEKTRRKGVAMGAIYEIGATLGLIKPYYIKVVTPDDDLVEFTISDIRYNDDTAELFTSYESIYGGSSFWKGFDEISPTIGLHAKVGMQWALGAFDAKAKAIEIGAMIDIFPRKIPLMVESETVKNQFVFLKFYASLQLGKRTLR